MVEHNREELQALTAARGELGPEYEPALVESFLERIEHQAARRARSMDRRPGRRTITPLVLGSLGLSIPLMSIAGAAAGLAGIALVCAAIVIVNVVALHR